MPTSKNKETKRIQFSYYTHITGPMGDVFEYLLRNNGHSNRTGKRMGVKAISAFWKPFSAQTVLQVGEKEARAIALNSIDELERQIELIKKTFNVQYGYMPGMTQREIEQLVDARMSHYIQNANRHNQLLPGSMPVPDNYNERSRRYAPSEQLRLR